MLSMALKYTGCALYQSWQVGKNQLNLFIASFAQIFNNIIRLLFPVLRNFNINVAINQYIITALLFSLK